MMKNHKIYETCKEDSFIKVYEICKGDSFILASGPFKYPEIPPAILELLEGIQIQSDVVSGLGVAAMGFGASILFRKHWGGKDKIFKIYREQWMRWFLVVSLLTLAFSLFFGFWSGAYRVGYLTEIATGWNSSLQCYIENAREHFHREYFNLLQCLAKMQLLFFCFGLLALLLAVVVGIPVKVDSGSGAKLDSDSGQSEHQSERSDAGA